LYPLPVNELLHRTALEQAQLIRQGQISSEELVRLYLDRIGRLNPQLNAFTDVFRRRALVTARWKDELRLRLRRPAGPFDGVPIGIKDLNVVRGAPTRWGSRGVPHLIMPFDDLNVAQLRRGGFVILGKLSTSELGAMPVTEPDIHPPTRNPWDLGHSAGGSSGGSGAAVASGMLPIAHGSDGAGSIRIPAAFCHLYGFKPSRGRVRHMFGMNDRQVLYTSGPLARTVDDAAAMLDVMAGIVDGRPHWAPKPERPFAELAKERPPALKVRFNTRAPHGQTHPEIAAAVERTAALLAEMGHDVAEAPLPEGRFEEVLPMWQRLIAQMPVLPWRWSQLQPVTRWLGAAGRRLRPAEVQALHVSIEARLRAALDTADLWLTPTVPQPAPRVGTYAGLDPAHAFSLAAEFGSFTAAFNITGQPAANLPLGLTSDGLPIGVQIGGRLFADGQVLAISRQIEEALPWRQRTRRRNSGASALLRRRRVRLRTCPCDRANGEARLDARHRRQPRQLAMEALVVGRIARFDTQQVIERARHEVALAHLGKAAHGQFEAVHLIRSLPLEHDLHHHRGSRLRLLGGDDRRIAEDDALALEHVQAAQARRRRQADLGGERRIAHAPVLLQQPEHVVIDGVELVHCNIMRNCATKF
jgi:amidase